MLKYVIAGIALVVVLIVGGTGIFLYTRNQAASNNTNVANNNSNNPSTIQPTMPPTATNDRTVTGKFLRIETGDYEHMIIANEDGEEESYMLYAAFDTVLLEKLRTDKSMTNKQVEFTWEEKTTFIPEAGDDITYKQITSLKVLN